MAKKSNGQTTREELVKALAEEMPEPNQGDKLKEAEEVIKADREARSEQFMSELRQLCAKYRVDLSAVVQVEAK